MTSAMFILVPVQAVTLYMRVSRSNPVLTLVQLNLCYKSAQCAKLATPIFFTANPPTGTLDGPTQGVGLGGARPG